MTSFAVAAGFMLVAALAWLLRPLLRRPERETSGGDDTQASNVAVYRGQLAELEAEFNNGALDRTRYEEGKRALMQRLAADVQEDVDDVGESGNASRSSRLLAIVLGIGLPLIAVGFYWRLGNTQALGLGAKDAALQREAAQMTPERIDAMVHKLEDYLQRHPDDGKGWSVLARAYRGLGKTAEAQSAFERAVALAPKDAELLRDFAEFLGVLAQGDLRGRPTELIEQALKLDPENPDTLALAGSAAAHRGDRAAAIKHWEKLLTLLPPEAEVHAAVQQAVSELRKQAVPQPAASKTAASIAVRVSLAPGVAGKVGEKDTLFVFARAAQGPKMPLAVLKAKPSELPHLYVLSDANAMAPEMMLSKFEQIVVGARVSKSGSPVAQSGDLEGASAVVKLGAKQVEIVIDRIVP